MPWREIQVPWDSQPQEVVWLDPTHWLTPLVRQGVIAGPRRNATGANAYTVSTASTAVTRIGAVDVLTGSGGHIAAPSVASAQAWTLISYGVLRTSGTTSAVATMAESPGSATFDRSLHFNSSGYVSNYVYDGAARFATVSQQTPANEPSFIAATATGASFGAYYKGQLAESAAANSGYAGYSTPELVLGYGAGLSGSESSAWSSAYVLLLTRALTLNELRELDANPWQLFAPRTQRILYASAASSGLPTLSAATYVPGSLTASGFRPRVTAS